MHCMESLQPGNVVQVITGGTSFVGMVVSLHSPRVGVAFASEDLPCLPDSRFFFTFQLQKLGDSLHEVAPYLDPSSYYALNGVEQELSLMRQFLVGY